MASSEELNGRALLGGNAGEGKADAAILLPLVVGGQAANGLVSVTLRSTWCLFRVHLLRTASTAVADRNLRAPVVDGVKVTLMKQFPPDATLVSQVLIDRR
jgi:hypothetical protein